MFWLAQKFGQQAVSFSQLFTEHDLLANNANLNDLVVYNLEVFLRKNLFDEISKLQNSLMFLMKKNLIYLILRLL